MFNGHKGDGDPKGELPGDNGEGDHENGEGDCIVGKGQHPVLKGEPLCEEEPDFFCVFHLRFRLCISNKHKKTIFHCHISH